MSRTRREQVIGDAWLCPRCGDWTTTASVFCRVCKSNRPEHPDIDRECLHIWMHYEKDEDASSYLNAPEGTAKWSEPVFVCSLCDLVQPEAWVEDRTCASNPTQGGEG